MRNLIYFLLFILFFLNCKPEKEFINVLILSGSNNHDWEQTTLALQEIFSSNRLFTCQITEKPDTLKSSDLRHFDVVLSNWNSWPENEIRWPKTAENALLNFVKKGVGLVTFHAATSAFYEWPAFKQITTGAWIDKTRHGKNSATQVKIINDEHPVTRGLNNFYVFDELWINAEKNETFEVLGTATNENLQNEKNPDQPAIMVAELGKGRVFHTILGHDSRALKNSGLTALLLRGTEWAARGKVNQSVPQELQKEKSVKKYNWLETDTSFALINENQTVWKYNFNSKHGRPFFHPVFLDRNNLTCLSPSDHPWHLGQWFSWKFINGVNYWEYLPKTFQSAGVTEITNIAFQKNEDFSAEIKLNLVYHPAEKENVLSEQRTIKITPSEKNRQLVFDYSFIFEALQEEVLLDRTPVLGEENGKSWGGYSGLSIRFSQDFMNPFFYTCWENNDSINGQNGNWIFMGFTGIDGNKTGSQIMVHPETFRNEAAWYTIKTEDHPFYYASPALLYFKPLVLKKGEKLTLNYRIIHYAKEVTPEEINKAYHNYIYQ